MFISRQPNSRIQVAQSKVQLRVARTVFLSQPHLDKLPHSSQIWITPQETNVQELMNKYRSISWLSTKHEAAL